MNNAVFEKNYGKCKKYQDIQLVAFLLTKEMKKAQIIMNKLVCLGLAILEISKIVMYQFSYDFVKTKYGEKAKLCYMDTYSFIAYIKTEDIYVDIAKDVF